MFFLKIVYHINLVIDEEHPPLLNFLIFISLIFFFLCMDFYLHRSFSVIRDILEFDFVIGVSLYSTLTFFDPFACLIEYGLFFIFLIILYIIIL